VVSSRRTITLRAQISTVYTKLLHSNVQQFRGVLVFKAHRLCVSLNSRLESIKEEVEKNKEITGGLKLTGVIEFQRWFQVVVPSHLELCG
jgi:hypothetical protein